MQFFLLFNYYIHIRSEIFLQIIGIGTSFSCYAANIFLFYHESQLCYNFPESYCFAAFRFINDIIVLNFEGDIWSKAKAI